MESFSIRLFKNRFDILQLETNDVANGHFRDFSKASLIKPELFYGQ